MNSDNPMAIRGSVTLRSLLADYVTLTKPELTLLSVLTALCGFYLGGSTCDVIGFTAIGIGTLLLGAGSGALNQYLEREYDRMMRRTERRPLPAGRISAQAGLVFGVVLSFAGLGVLFLFAGILSGILGSLTIISYLFWYTPLKRRSPVATMVGGIPGALPPLIGWAGATQSIQLGGVILFLILYFWQMPHFFSLAWLYRKDYARAGYRMLSVLDRDGTKTANHILAHTGFLAVSSILMTVIGLTGGMYAVGAGVLGVIFLGFGLLFRFSSEGREPHSDVLATRYSRYLFFASLLYLPALMFLMTVDKM